MAFDFKKEERELYLPKKAPSIISVPPMTYVAVRGAGDPNPEGGSYQEAISILYALAYTIKMAKMGDEVPKGYFDFVVPPLEGFWWQEGRVTIDYSRKDLFQWMSVIRVPDFVTLDVFAWAAEQAARKKDVDTGKAELLSMEEGLCAQVLYVGPYDDEPATIEQLDDFIKESGYELDISDTASGRHHHEIYLSDPRRTAPEKLKTVIRHPVRR